MPELPEKRARVHELRWTHMTSKSGIIAKEGGGHHPIASLHRRRVPILRGAPTQNLEKRKEDEHSDYLPSLDVKFCIKNQDVPGRTLVLVWLVGHGK